MRHLFSTALLVASLAGQIHGHTSHSSSPYEEAPVSRRKTLGFGPAHPHAVFHSTPYSIQTNGFTPMDPSMDPMEVARVFVDDVLSQAPSEGKSYKIRDDSYTDKNTGVTHVYVRQVVNGLEVSDGDMNINIKDGMVLSYGNSFYKGAAPVGPENVSLLRDVRLEACEEAHSQLTSSLRPPTSDGQVVMGGDDREPLSPEIMETMHHNCYTAYQAPEFSSDDPVDFRPALLHFMHTATPDAQLSDDIERSFEEYVAKMEVTPVHHFAPGERHAPEFQVSNVPDTVNPVKAKLAYIQVPNEAGDATELSLVWKFEVEMEDNWYEAAVSTQAPHKIVSVVDWASDAPIPKPSEPVVATYRVFPWGVNDPAEGERSIQKENFDILASPAGWHAIPYAHDPQSANVKPKGGDFWRNTTTTWGNNVFAQENWEGQNSYIWNYRPDGGPEKVFDFEYNPKDTDKGEDALAEARKYINATVTQLFYTSNLVHDLYYRYGFDEVAGNFQQYNFGRGGRENDGVIANAQDGSGFNNANFMTPPDGQNGRMRMYLWNTALPYRDGDLEAGIVIHELSHGLSTRLTGGPLNSGCLGWGESGGMGEGWGDFLATTIRSTKVYHDYPMGAWAANREAGIRNYIYSVNNTVNPSVYKTLDKPGYWGVHAIGEVWAEMLFIVGQRLIEKHGFSDSLYPPAPLEDGTVPPGDFYRSSEAGKPLIPKHGNSLVVQLVLNGMKLQPCRPTFFQARDAIIQADQVLTGGENFCTLWKAFAERGLGSDAKIEGQTPWGGGIRTNGYAVPHACDVDEE